jgi:hypothetical protein
MLRIIASARGGNSEKNSPINSIMELGFGGCIGLKD